MIAYVEAYPVSYRYDSFRKLNAPCAAPILSDLLAHAEPGRAEAL
jgi:hypothetical protein